MLPTLSSAASSLELTDVQILQVSKTLIDRGDTNQATEILSQIPPLGNVALEIERYFLMAQIASRNGDFGTAIKIYRTILDQQPNLARIRFELALCYIKTRQWYRADYHIRLAAADNDLAPEIQRTIKKLLYIIRQNKNWNAWFNFGVAPDNNINTGAHGEECVNTIFGPLCRQLPEPESAVGYSFMLGGNYEFKLSDRWRWKSDTNIYTNVYDKHDYDDLYISAATGPRYIFQNGDIWTAAMATRRWYGWNAYSWQIGGRIDSNYDFTRKLTGGLQLRYLSSYYDDFRDFMNGDLYTANLRLQYAIDARMYLIFRSGLERENTTDVIYSNWRKSLSVGFGAELPYGFHIYLEPSIYWTDYDAGRWVVKDGDFMQITEHSFTHSYSVSLSNNKLDIWGFVPTLNINYTNRHSNIWQREFDKFSIGITMQQRF